MLLGTWGMNVSAQNAVATLKGEVTDEYGKPLAGVVVNSENGRNGTTTGIDGKYVLTVNDGSDAIVFSYLGRRDVTKKIAGKETIDVKNMPLDVDKNDEIIDMGWTKQRRGDISGAVSSIKGKSLESAPVATLSMALAGQISGLSVIEQTYSPENAWARVLLRGASNPKNANESPAVVIDGVPYFYGYWSNPFEYITAREIESITVLKDASTEALYGVKGGNGVIVITTKRGQKGKVNIDVAYDQSVRQPIKTPKVFHSWEYATLKNEAAYNDNPSGGKTQIYSPYQIAQYASGENRDLYPDNNWYDMFYRELATMERANISISGGSDKFVYYTNVNFMHQSNQFRTEDELYKSSFNTNWVNFRSNVDVQVNKYLQAYLRVAGNVLRTRNPVNQSYSELYNALFQLPANMYGPVTPAVYNTITGELEDEGGVPIVGEHYTKSVYGMLNKAGSSKTTHVNIMSQFGLKLDLGFVTKGLSLSGYMAYQTESWGALLGSRTYEKAQRNNNPNELGFRTYGSDIDGPITYAKGSGSFYHLDFKGSLDYARNFGKHSVQATAFMFYQNLVQNNYSSPECLPYNTVLSGFQAAYGYDNRYLIKFDLGYSGTEQFAPDYRFTTTPAVSGAWVVSNEPFMKNAEWLSMLKIRASYGKTALDGLNNGRFGYVDNITFTNGGVVNSLMYTTTEGKKGNLLLQAQTMKKQNYGIDFGLFNGLTVSFDYFRERMDDMLISSVSTIPDYQGIPTGNYPNTNSGIYENKGYDFTIDYYKRINKDWSFNVGGWLSYNRNKMIYQDETELGEGYAYRKTKEGFPLGQQFGLLVDWSKGNGFFNTQEELDADDFTYGSSIPKPRLGDLRFVDVNGDFVIDDKDQVPLGYGALPQVYYAFNGGFTYKNLEFNILFQGVGRWSSYYQSNELCGLTNGGIFNRLHERAWTPERYAAGEKITFPALSNNLTESTTKYNSYFIQDRAYLRLKNVEIAYTLPLKWSQTISSDKIRFSLSAWNLVTWDRMKTTDFGPEATDLWQVPAQRVYNIGVSLIF